LFGPVAYAYDTVHAAPFDTCQLLRLMVALNVPSTRLPDTSSSVSTRIERSPRWFALVVEAVEVRATHWTVGSRAAAVAGVPTCASVEDDAGPGVLVPPQRHLVLYQRAPRRVVGFGGGRPGYGDVGAIGEIVGEYRQARIEGELTDGLVSLPYPSCWTYGVPAGPWI
jgi:hypothetical protein